MTISDDTLIRNLPLSVRIKNALMQAHAPDLPYYNRDRTFGEAKTIPDEKLLKLFNFGHLSLQEWVNFRDRALGLEAPYARASRRAKLHSLLLAHESAVIALYDIQRADANLEDFADIDREASIAKRQEALASAREAILNQMNVRGDQ